MRERVTKLLSELILTTSLLVALFPFYVVNADEATYTVVSGNCFAYLDGIGSYIDKHYYFSVGNNSSEVRALSYINGNNIVSYFVSKNTFVYSNNSDTYSCSATLNSAPYTTTIDNITYYYYSGMGNKNSYTSNLPTFNQVLNISQVIYYTFGDGAIDPAPPAPTYGDLIIEGYSTDIAGSGSAAIQNIDHIRWNPDFDTNGNDISNLQVRLKIVPGNYVSSRATDLALQTYDDFIEDQFNSDETVYNVSDGEAVISWDYIVDKFDNILNRIYLFNMGLNFDTWEKQGWLYKLRLEDETNDYIGDWQTVYSSTSSGVQNDLNIVNNNTISQEFITTLQEINSINNVDNNWTVNNTEISVENNYTEPQQGEKPWWAYLLESILNTFNITNNYIYEGDSNTQNITNTVNDSDDDMNRKINEYQQFEDTFINDMDDNLTDIDTDIDFLSDNKFIASANWVSQQYNRMTNNTVIGSFIGFSLLFGLALIFIGKIR